MTDSVSQQVLDYRNEISTVVTRELAKLADYRCDLQRLREAGSASRQDRDLIERAVTAVGDAEKLLRDLLAFSLQDDAAVAFNETVKFAGFAFKSSVAVRTSFFRHTPTLAGCPHSLDPGQNHQLNPGEHIIDYSRNAYYQYQDARSGSPRVLVDHPELKKVAHSIARLFRAGPAPESSVLFSSAMGAIGSLIDYITLVSRKAGQTNRVGQRCWFEIRQYVDERYAGEFALLDENDTDAILDAIESPDVCGIVLEPMANFPEMPVIDLDRIAGKLRTTRFPKPKIVVFDVVHTPELDIQDRYFAGTIPDNLCVALVISGVKFLQAGWDISKSGLALLSYGRGSSSFDNQTIYEKLIDIRSISGRAPSIEEAHLADIETPASFRSRMNRYDENTRYFAVSLDAWLRKHGLGHVSSPWLPTHPGHEVAMRDYGTGGRLLFLFFNPELVVDAELGVLFKELSTAAEQEGISLMTAPSFGMAAPHIHIVIRPRLPTTLRVSTGSTDRTTVERLLQFICGHLEKYLA